MEPTDGTLVPAPSPKTVHIGALPTHFRKRVMERRLDRAAARSAAENHAFNAFCSACGTIMGAMFFSAGIGGGHALLIIVGMLLVMFAPSAFIIETWRCCERASYLYGTRDESRYLPRGASALASEELALFSAALAYNADVRKWHEVQPLVEAHGDDRHRAMSAKAACRLDARRAALLRESERLWAAAASSEDPSPRALPAPDAPKALPPPSDWGPVERVPIDMLHDPKNS
jgi:hypothetical protein